MSDLDIVSGSYYTPGPVVDSCDDTVADLIAATQRHLYGPQSEVLNVLNGSIDDGDTGITLTYDLDGFGPRRVISIDDELLFVLSVNTVAKTAAVIRGHRGTTPASHSNGAVVEVAPRFPRGFIRAALKDEIKSWPRELFATGAYDVTVGSVARGYDLPIGVFYRILAAYVSPATPTTSALWSTIPYEVRTGLSTDDFASGNSITFQTSFTPARTVRVIYSKPFVTADMSDEVAVNGTIGVPCPAMDIAPLGAAWRLMQGREVRRTDLNAQGTNKSAEQVPGGLSSATASSFKTRRDERLREELIRLRSAYPIRF